jgi:hypothetical protein
MYCSLNFPEIIEKPQKEELYKPILDVFFMAKAKDFPLTSLKSTLGNLESSLRDAESQFKEDKDLSNSIEQTRESADKLNKQMKSS